ncbi:MAG: hypothetical protein LWX11_07980 [Firmicutes bacterium]|nr:hypothetical protein [Bacillota bacterium]
MLTLASASGNVFGYVWAEDAPAFFDGPRWAKVLCPRGEGFGLDGLFLVQRPTPGQPWRMDHWEPDGSLTFCSNGTRAAAALVDTQGEQSLNSSGSEVRIRIAPGEVALRLPEGPGFDVKENPLALDVPHAFGWTGTPHLVLDVPDTRVLDLETLAPPLRFHPDLPEGANVSFVQVLEPGRARIRSWERGVEGETLCCGQGAAVAGAWLAQRTGLRSWVFQPAGADSVRVSVASMVQGVWSQLWIGGPVRRLGRVELDPSILERLAWNVRGTC